MEARFEAVKQIHNWPEEFHLKKEQLQVLTKLEHGRNVFGILPTGFGKSMTYIVPAITGMGMSLVISPLKALMEDQAVTLARDHNIKTVILRNDIDPAVRTGVERCEYDIIFSSPEVILSDQWCGMLRDTYKGKLGVFAIDEVHCVMEWGTKDFRSEFKELVKLRSFFDKTPWVMLTATISETQRLQTIDHLKFDVETVDTVAVLPDRPNITIHYHCRPGMDYEVELQALVSELKSKGGRLQRQ